MQLVNFYIMLLSVSHHASQGISDYNQMLPYLFQRPLGRLGQ